MTYDLVIAGGDVLSPDATMLVATDVAFEGGLVAAVGPGLAPLGRKVIDARGSIVTPGLIDLHTHLYERVSALGLNADATCLPSGVTTAVDAGTAGVITLPGLRDYCAARSRTRLLAFVNVSSIGLILDDERELSDMSYADESALVDAISANPSFCVGVKVRVSKKVLGENDLQVLELAVRVAERTWTRVMVHVTRSKYPIGDVLSLLRPGDIVTHVLHGHDHSIIDGGRVADEVWDARARGVRMDVGHGRGSFSFAVAKAAMGEGFRPDTISTDLHTGCVNGPCYDLPTTMSKFLSLGMSLVDVLAATTLNSAHAIGAAGNRGSLTPGFVGDAALLNVVEGRFRFEDCHGVEWTGTQKIQPVATILGGEVVARPDAMRV